METLFQKSLYTEYERLKAQAMSEVGNLDRAIFSNPALAGVVQKITERHRINIAEFRGEVTAERRIEQRTIDDYGRRVTVPVKLYDVSIPFVGDQRASGSRRRGVVCPSARPRSAPTS